MDMDATLLETSESLMSSQSKSSELQIVVHPVVLFGLSDHISRHFMREQSGPVVGAILGQQTGREITMEHTFECHLRETPEVEGGYLLDEERFSSRLEQMVTVHRDRDLDFVGWYTLVPSAGPQSAILPMHTQILDKWNDSAIILGFHCSEAGMRALSGKTPATMYETIYEAEDRKTGEQDGEDRRMQDGETTMQLRFREVPYSIETDETELISMNYVAAGTGNASSASAGTKEDRATRSTESAGKGKGKRRLVEAEGDETEVQFIDEASVDLTREEDAMSAALTAKANALRMLHCRIRLLTTYLESLPSSYVNGHTSSHANEGMETDQITPSLCILRQIRAIVNRLDLVVPANTEDFEKEIQREDNNANLTNLMNGIMQSLNGAREVGKKFSIVQITRASSRRPDAFDMAASVSPSFNIPRVGDILI